MWVFCTLLTSGLGVSDFVIVVMPEVSSVYVVVISLFRHQDLEYLCHVCIQ